MKRELKTILSFMRGSLIANFYFRLAAYSKRASRSLQKSDCVFLINILAINLHFTF